MLSPTSADSPPTTPIDNNTNAQDRSTPRPSRSALIIEFVQVVVGIYIAFMIMSVYQEKVSRRPYGGQYFDFPLFLVFLQCVLNTIVAYVKMNFFSKSKKQSNIPARWFGYAAFGYVWAVVASNAALMYVNYPTQVLAKSCKMIPVMLMNILLAKKSYKIYKIVAVVMVSVGISLFMIDKASHGSKHKGGAGESQNETWGLLLLVLSLAMDGVYNSIQTKMREHFSAKPSGDELMLKMNAFATLFVAIGMIISGELVPAVTFCSNHPAIISDLAIFCITMAIGQIFIFWCVSAHGTLVCSLITTTRKFFTILVSIIWFQHAMSTVQWVSVGIVFAGLMYDVVESLRFEENKHEE